MNGGRPQASCLALAAEHISSGCRVCSPQAESFGGISYAAKTKPPQSSVATLEDVLLVIIQLIFLARWGGLDVRGGQPLLQAAVKHNCSMPQKLERNVNVRAAQQLACDRVRDCGRGRRRPRVQRLLV